MGASCSISAAPGPARASLEHGGWGTWTWRRALGRRTSREKKKNCLSPQEGWSSRRDGGAGSARRVGASRRLGWWCVGESLLAVVLYRHRLAQFTKSGRSVGDCSSTVWTCQLYNLHGGNRLWWSRDALFDVTHRCWRKLATAVTRQWRHAELKCRPSADRRQSRKRNRPCEPSRSADVEEQLRR